MIVKIIGQTSLGHVNFSSSHRFCTKCPRTALTLLADGPHRFAEVGVGVAYGLLNKPDRCYDITLWTVSGFVHMVRCVYMYVRVSIYIYIYIYIPTCVCWRTYFVRGCRLTKPGRL